MLQQFFGRPRDRLTTTRRNIGLQFDQLAAALKVCGDNGEATLRTFIASLTETIAAAPRFQKLEEFRTSP